MAFFAWLLVDKGLTRTTNVLHFRVVEDHYTLDKRLE